MTKILLTGGTGYLGRHTARALLDAGHQLTVLRGSGSDTSALASAAGQRFDELEYGAGYNGLHAQVLALKPDVIIHLASVSRGKEDEAGMRAMIEANLLLPSLLARAAVDCGAKGFVGCGTSWQTSGTTDNYDPFNFYAATKQAAEDLLVPFAKMGLPAVFLRMFDNYGPDDPRNKVVDLIVDALTSGTSLKMSPGEQKLDLVYITDAAAAVARSVEYLLEAPRQGLAVFGVSSRRACRLRDLAATIEEVAGKPAPIAWGARDYRRGEIMQPIATLPHLPGWAATVGLKQGIEAVWRAKNQ